MAQRGLIDYQQHKSAQLRGNGSLFQMATGSSPISGNVPMYDANANLIDSGVVPGGGGGGGFFGISSFVTPPITSWSTDNASNGTYGTGGIDTSNGYPYFTAVKSNFDALGMAYRTAPTAPYTISALLLHDISGAPPLLSGAGAAAAYMIGFRDGSGKILAMRVGFDTNSFIAVSKYTNSTTFSAHVLLYGEASAIAFMVARNPAWLRIEDNNTDLKFYWSIDGNHWELFTTLGRTAFFSSGPTQVGFGGWVNGNGVKVAAISWG